MKLIALLILTGTAVASCGGDTGQDCTPGTTYAGLEDISRGEYKFAYGKVTLFDNGFQPLASLCGEYTFDETLRLNLFETDVPSLDMGWSEEYDFDEWFGYHEDNGRIMPNVGLVTSDFNNTLSDKTTFVMRFYSEGETLSDCVIWGHDVAGILAGDLPTANPSGVTAAGEISSTTCAESTVSDQFKHSLGQ